MLRDVYCLYSKRSKDQIDLSFEGDCNIAVEQREIVGEQERTRTFFQRIADDFISWTKQPMRFTFVPLLSESLSAFTCAKLSRNVLRKLTVPRCESKVRSVVLYLTTCPPYIRQVILFDRFSRLLRLIATSSIVTNPLPAS